MHHQCHQCLSRRRYHYRYHYHLQSHWLYRCRCQLHPKHLKHLSWHPRRTARKKTDPCLCPYLCPESGHAIASARLKCHLSALACALNHHRQQQMQMQQLRPGAGVLRLQPLHPQTLLLRRSHHDHDLAAQPWG